MVERQQNAALQGLKTFFHIIYCFLVIYLLLLIFLIPIILMMCYRFILSLIFSTFYKGRYKLLECANAFFGLDRYANVFTMYFFMYINGPCDIDLLRQRIHHVFTTFKGKNGTRPYEVMLCGLVRKFGFFCWEDMRDSFDINHQVRYLPGCGDPSQIYSEEEVFDAVGKLADDLWPDSRPRWEILVVPQLRKDATGEICSAIHLRLHHAYVDGISAAQIMRLCVADKPPAKFSMDPVNPPIPARPLWVKLVTYLQVIFLGPWSSLRLMGNKEEHIFYEGPLVGGKYFGRSKMNLSVSKMKEIREAYGCTTSSILQCAITGALRKIALKKGYPIPDEILGSIILALLPYPDEYPQNHAILMPSYFPVAIQQAQERLLKVDRICRANTHPLNYYTVVASKWFFRIVGVFPAAVIGKTMGSLKLSYFVSNVPGTNDTMFFNGNDVVDLFGVGPIINGCRYFAGVTSYKDRFSFGFQAEKSSLIRNREDLNELMGEFENEISVLLKNVHFDQC